MKSQSINDPASNTTEMFKAQKCSRDIVKIVHVTLVIQQAGTGRQYNVVWTPMSERLCILVENENRVDDRTQHHIDVRTKRNIDVKTQHHIDVRTQCQIDVRTRAVAIEYFSNREFYGKTHRLYKYKLSSDELYLSHTQLYRV